MRTPTLGYSPQDTLGIGVEFIRQLKRRRTFVAFLLVVTLPLIVVAAVRFGPSSNGDAGSSQGGGFGGGNFDLVGLATSGAWNFTITMLLFSSGFLLVIIAAMFLGHRHASGPCSSNIQMAHRFFFVACPFPNPQRAHARQAVDA